MATVSFDPSKIKGTNKISILNNSDVYKTIETLSVSYLAQSYKMISF